VRRAAQALLVAALVGCADPSLPRESVELRDELVRAGQFARSGTTIDLAVLFDADWDRVAILTPYTTDDEARRILGFDFAVTSTGMPANEEGVVLVLANGEAVAGWFYLTYASLYVAANQPVVIRREEARLRVTVDDAGNRSVDRVR
jgi:hypothetical protein